MGFRFHKSIKIGDNARLNLSKSGVGYSFGFKGFRFTQRAGGSQKGGCAGCLTLLIVWPLQLCWLMIYGTFWLLWQMCYWTVKLCFILPIKLIIKLIKGRAQTETPSADDQESAE